MPFIMYSSFAFSSGSALMLIAIFAISSPLQLFFKIVGVKRRHDQDIICTFSLNIEESEGKVSRELPNKVCVNQLPFYNLCIDTAVTGDEESEVLYSKDRSYAEGLVMGTLENQQAIDEILEQHARDWSIDRMAAVDRNIARMAVFELKFQEEKVDTAVIINEAVNLAKKFGTDDSSRFINGILSSVEKA